VLGVNQNLKMEQGKKNKNTSMQLYANNGQFKVIQSMRGKRVHWAINNINTENRGFDGADDLASARVSPRVRRKLHCTACGCQRHASAVAVAWLDGDNAGNCKGTGVTGDEPDESFVC
jgi:hypothetical protein